MRGLRDQTENKNMSRGGESGGKKKPYLRPGDIVRNESTGTLGIITCIKEASFHYDRCEWLAAVTWFEETLPPPRARNCARWLYVNSARMAGMGFKLVCRAG